MKTKTDMSEAISVAIAFVVGIAMVIGIVTILIAAFVGAWEFIAESQPIRRLCGVMDRVRDGW